LENISRIPKPHGFRETTLVHFTGIDAQTRIGVVTSAPLFSAFIRLSMFTVGVVSAFI
jgi:hypothetical protein